MNTRIIITRAVTVLLCIFFVTGFGTSAWCWGKKEIELEAKAVKLAREVVKGGYSLVTTQELKEWADKSKDMLIVDTMPYEASYQKNHIPGAVQILFPIPDMEKWETSLTEGKTRDDYIKLLGPDKNRVIVIYCGFVKCTRSHNGAAWAVKLGYKNVFRYPGGIKAWKQGGYKVE